MIKVFVVWIIIVLYVLIKALEYWTDNVLSPKVPHDERLLYIENGFQSQLSILRKNFYIGINNEQKKLRIYYNGSPYADMYKDFASYTNTFDYEQIIGVEIIEDEVSISKTNRKNQIVGAGIGAAVAGGTGAVIGGLSGKTSTSQEVQNITLRVIIDDYNNPIYDLPFLNQKDSIKKTNSIYKNAIKMTYQWHNILSKVINEKNIEIVPVNSQYETNNEPLKETVSTNINYVAEIERIASLKNKGLITEDEFNILKNKIIH